jgi:hypothetical protein
MKIFDFSENIIVVCLKPSRSHHCGVIVLSTFP